MTRASESYIIGFAIGCALVMVGFFAIAVFAPTPYSIIALSVIPVPFIGLIIATVARARIAIQKIREYRNSSPR